MALLDHHDDIDGVLRLATELLPLEDLATGPTLDCGFAGNGSEQILDLIVSRLDAHPGKGWPLIRTALSNATVRTRNMAVAALTEWPPATIPTEAFQLARQALRIEPDEHLRDHLRQFLDRQADPTTS